MTARIHVANAYRERYQILLCHHAGGGQSAAEKGAVKDQQMLILVRIKAFYSLDVRSTTVRLYQQLHQPNSTPFRAPQSNRIRTRRRTLRSKIRQDTGRTAALLLSGWAVIERPATEKHRTNRQHAEYIDAHHTCALRSAPLAPSTSSPSCPAPPMALSHRQALAAGAGAGCRARNWT